MTNPPPATLRDAWTAFIDPADYDAHMERNGQARANAALVAALIARHRPAGDRLLVAGAGTGGWLDQLAPALEPYRTTCTDISATMLDRLVERAAGSGVRIETIVDDLEDTRLPAQYDAAIVVLVFEHIDWRRGVASLARLGVERCFVVVQENPPQQVALMTVGREPIGTMRAFTEVLPCLVPQRELEAAFRESGYRLSAQDSVGVPDGKRMTGLVFCRGAESA